MPFEPGTLAAAEEVNAVLSDIATALTNSVPTDGSAAITGNLNMNGYSITGANDIRCNTLEASSTVTTSVLNATGGVYLNTLYGGVNGNGQSLYGLGYLGANEVQSFGNMDASGTITGGTINTGGNVVANGQVLGSYLHSSGDINAAGTFTGGAVNVGGNISGANFNTGGRLSAYDIQTVSDVYCGGYGMVYLSYASDRAFAFVDFSPYIYCYENGGAVGSLVPPSTARVKNGIVYSEFDCLAAVMATPLFAFRRQGSDQTTPVGFVAEEQHAVFPESVLMADEKPWGIDLMTAVATLYGAVQQLAMVRREA